MSDLTMCANQECKLREDCYRAKAPISHYQSWCAFVPDSDTQCEHKIPLDRFYKKCELGGFKL